MRSPEVRVGRVAAAPMAVVTAIGLLACAALGTRSALAAPAHRFETEAERSYFRDLKHLELTILHERARAEKRERAEICRRIKRLPKGRTSSRPVVEVEEERTRLGVIPGAPPLARSERDPRFVSPSNAGVLGLDSPVSDRRLDATLPAVTQSEVSVAAHGLDVLAAWNDGAVFTPPGLLGFGISRDGGRTWRDGGSPPVRGDVAIWLSDPTVAVDESTGTFYLGGLVISSPDTQNALAVISGTFADSGFVWGEATVVRSVRDTIPDKPWLAVDSKHGILYLASTTFVVTRTTTTDWIDVQRSTDGNRTWSAPQAISTPEDKGLVHGARPAPGPDGEVHVVWSAVDTTEEGRGADYLRLRTSRDGGASYGPQSTVARIFSNFGSGAPGFNRGYGLNFPAIAVDRSEGPFRGRVYVTWHESLNAFDDLPGGPGERQEREPNNEPAVADLLDLATTMRGKIDVPGDVDYYWIPGRQGETVVVFVDSLETGLGLSVRLFCADLRTQLALNAPPRAARRRLLYFTVPENGAYGLQFASGVQATGRYRFRTGLAGQGAERGRDHRDVFVAHSDDGERWSEPARVNAEPPLFDDWLPEVAVSESGIAFVSWYDWRDAAVGTCAGASRVRLARSTDGGTRWAEVGALSEVSTAWSRVASNLVPNQGDYMTLIAGRDRLVACWSDGRNGDPDVFAATLDLEPPGPPAARSPLTLAQVRPNPAVQEIVAELVLPEAEPARVELYDHLGRRWRSESIPFATRGRQAFHLALDPRMPAGIYLLRVVQGTHSAAKRVAIVR